MFKIYIIADQTTTTYNNEKAWRAEIKFLEFILEQEASYEGNWAIF